VSQGTRGWYNITHVVRIDRLDQGIGPIVEPHEYLLNMYMCNFILMLLYINLIYHIIQKVGCGVVVNFF